MVLFQIEFAGEVQLSRVLSRVTDRAQNLRPFLDRIGEYLREVAQEQFESEGGRSRAWRPLSPGYAAQKLARFGQRSILVATGDLRDSLSRTGGRHIEQVIGEDSLKFGTSVPYASYHQGGTERMPQRRILDLVEDDRQHIMRDLQRHLFEGLER